MMAKYGYKVLTHDYRAPIRGGESLWDGGILPFTLPTVDLDKGAAECSYGWNFCGDLHTALRIGGLWPTGRPSVALAVASVGASVKRGDKLRAESLELIRIIPEDEIAAAIGILSQAFAPHAEPMADEQRAWRAALARPRRDAAAVEQGLRAALGARGLDWKLKRFEAARAAWDAWAARDARDPWAARDARDPWAARDWAARAAWDAWAARDARDAWAAWAARAALTLGFASRQGWIKHEADLLTRGIRDAYSSGLDLVIPTGPSELGWAMTP